MVDDRARINAVTATHYADSAIRYRQDAYNASGLFAWEEAAVERYFGDVATLLVASAGGGRQVLALTGRGFNVSAFECSPLLVEEGRRRLERAGVQPAFVLAAPDEVPKLGMFDGVIVGWGAYSHIAGSAARVAFLRRLREQIAGNGPILVSFRMGSRASRHLRTIAALGTAIRRLRRRGEPVEIGDELRGTFGHSAIRDEIEKELDAAGFQPLFYSAEPFGHAVGIARARA